MNIKTIFTIVIGFLLLLISIEIIKIIKYHLSGQYKIDYDIRYKTDEWVEYKDIVQSIAKEQEADYVFLTYSQFVKEMKRFVKMGANSIYYSEANSSLYRLGKYDNDRLVMFDYIMENPIGITMREAYVIMKSPKDFIKYKIFLTIFFSDKEKCKQIAGEVVK